LNFIF
jgi:hypothetical protein